MEQQENNSHEAQANFSYEQLPLNNNTSMVDSGNKAAASQEAQPLSQPLPQSQSNNLTHEVESYSDVLQDRPLTL